MVHLIEKYLDEKIRPSLQAHGGNIEIIDFDNQQLFVKMLGGCQGCRSSNATLQGAVIKMLQGEFPEILQIIDLTDHSQREHSYL